mmetsp:Transcript_93659/g.162692  ORF Transcript_93659/g.162692 Transcript_93659/m.162692 type:complete len:383 (-) Transcript_93659:240-1388(-)
MARIRAQAFVRRQSRLLRSSVTTNSSDQSGKRQESTATSSSACRRKRAMAVRTTAEAAEGANTMTMPVEAEAAVGMTRILENCPSTETRIGTTMTVTAETIATMTTVMTATTVGVVMTVMTGTTGMIAMTAAGEIEMMTETTDDAETSATTAGVTMTVIGMTMMTVTEGAGVPEMMIGMTADVAMTVTTEGARMTTTTTIVTTVGGGTKSSLRRRPLLLRLLQSQHRWTSWVVSWTLQLQHQLRLQRRRQPRDGMPSRVLPRLRLLRRAALGILLELRQLLPVLAQTFLATLNSRLLQRQLPQCRRWAASSQQHLAWGNNRWVGSNPLPLQPRSRWLASSQRTTPMTSAAFRLRHLQLPHPPAPQQQRLLLQRPSQAISWMR